MLMKIYFNFFTAMYEIYLIFYVIAQGQFIDDNVLTYDFILPKIIDHKYQTK